MAGRPGAGRRGSRTSSSSSSWSPRRSAWRDPTDLIERQRDEYLQSLRDLDARLAAAAHGPTAELLIEGAVLHLKADLEWLDLIEERLAVGTGVGMSALLEARGLARTYDSGERRGPGRAAASTSSIESG